MRSAFYLYFHGRRYLFIYLFIYFLLFAVMIHIPKNQNLIWFGFMVFNATFNNISVTSWRSVLLVEKPGENHQPAPSH
jgi:hypothetical protein